MQVIWHGILNLLIKLLLNLTKLRGVICLVNLIFNLMYLEKWTCYAYFWYGDRCYRGHGYKATGRASTLLTVSTRCRRGRVWAFQLSLELCGRATHAWHAQSDISDEEGHGGLRRVLLPGQLSARAVGTVQTRHRVPGTRDNWWSGGFWSVEVWHCCPVHSGRE